MKKSKGLIGIGFTVLLAAMLVFTDPGVAMTAEASIGYTESQKQATEAQIQSNKEKLQQIQSQIQALKDQSASALTQKEQLDIQTTTMQQNIDLTEDLIAQYEGGIQAKISEIALKQAEVDEKYELLKEQLRLSYENGTENYLAVIFSSSSLLDMLTRIERMRSLTSYQETQMKAIEEEAEYLVELKAKLETELSEQETLKETLVLSKADLMVKVEEANQTLLQLQITNADKQQQYEQLVKSENELNAFLQAIEADLLLQAKEALATGAYIWPVNKNHTWISSPFGYRYHPIYGAYGMHSGIDIPASYGEPVYASNNGTVVVAQYHNSYGNYVMIDHGNGVSTLYAHNSSLCVTVGQKVNKGDVIARIGSTGDSTGCHCHFEVRINGKAVNPLSKSNAENAYVVVPS